MDRRRPEEGYVKENVIVISNRANSIKLDASTDELKKIYEFYDAILCTVEEMRREMDSGVSFD